MVYLTLLKGLTFFWFLAESERRALEWLCSINPEDDLRAFQESRAVNTGGWVLQHETYLKWLHTPGSLLWIKGQSTPSKPFNSHH